LDLTKHRQTRRSLDSELRRQLRHSLHLELNLHCFYRGEVNFDLSLDRSLRAALGPAKLRSKLIKKYQPPDSDLRNDLHQ